MKEQFGGWQVIEAGFYDDNIWAVLWTRHEIVTKSMYLNGRNQVPSLVLTLPVIDMPLAEVDMGVVWLTRHRWTARKGS